MLLAIHAQQVERYGGAHGIVDGNTVRSALARPIQRWACEPEADLAELTAALFVGPTRSQGFVDGNKRTGLACSLVFLALNSHALHVPPRELYALAMRVARNEIGDEVVAAYLRARIEAK